MCSFLAFSHSINSMEYTRMAGTRIAQQLLVTLTPHLSQLVKENIKKISLRVNLNPDDVCIPFAEESSERIPFLRKVS